MFTGLVYGVSSVVALERNVESLRLVIDLPRIKFENILLGASISINGVCLTLVQRSLEQGGSEFFPASFDVSSETLSCTNLGKLNVGDHVHIEASLKLGDELGGHLVSGHVDGVAKLCNRKFVESYLQLEFYLELETFDRIAPYLVVKGSIAVDGVSLTVNEVCLDIKKREASFTVMLIPETLSKTRFSDLSIGDLVNVEADMLAKYFCQYKRVTGELSL